MSATPPYSRCQPPATSHQLEGKGYHHENRREPFRAGRAGQWSGEVLRAPCRWVGTTANRLSSLASSFPQDFPAVHSRDGDTPFPSQSLDRRIVSPSPRHPKHRVIPWQY